MQGSFLWSQQIAPFGEALGRSIGFPQSGALFSLPFPVLTCAIRPVLMAINQQYSVATGLLANGSRLASNQIQACISLSPVAHMGCGTCYGQTLVIVPLPDRLGSLESGWCSADKIAWKVLAALRRSPKWIEVYV